MPDEYSVINLDQNQSIASHISVAGDSAGRRKGLLEQENLDGGAGLWIAPCEAVHTFGMKMPIDVIFLDRHLKVKKIVPALRPRRIALSFSSHSVLEVQSGAIERSGTRVGHQLRFSPV